MLLWLGRCLVQQRCLPSFSCPAQGYLQHSEHQTGAGTSCAPLSCCAQVFTLLTFLFGLFLFFSLRPPCPSLWPWCPGQGTCTELLQFQLSSKRVNAKSISAAATASATPQQGNSFFLFISSQLLFPGSPNLRLQLTCFGAIVVSSTAV